MFSFFKKRKTTPPPPSARRDEDNFTKYPGFRRHYRSIVSGLKTRPAYDWGVLLKFYCGEPNSMWPEQMYLVHLFRHERYNDYDDMIQFDQILLGSGKYRSEGFT